MALYFFLGVFHSWLSIPGVFFPRFSVTRLTAKARAEKEWVKSHCRLFTLPHFWAFAASTIRDCSLCTILWHFLQAISCHAFGLGGSALTCVIICLLPWRGSRIVLVVRHQAEVCPLSRRLILLLRAQALSAPLQSGIRFLCSPLPAALSALLTDRFPRGETTGLLCSVWVTKAG